MTTFPHEHFPFMYALMLVENGVKSGYNPRTNTWSAHQSLEGGTGTIGYGHKLTLDEERNGILRIDGRDVDFMSSGLPDHLCAQLFLQDVKAAESTALGQWNHYRKQADDNLPNSTWLPLKYKCVLTNLVYNVGTLVRNERLQWPNLFRAMGKNDDAGVVREMVTSYFRPDGTKVKLTKRADDIAVALGLKG